MIAYYPEIFDITTPTGAIFGGENNCRRFALWRTWNHRDKTCAFIGLNPSSADETEDDPTIRRCVRFARDWGYGSLVMLNLFDYRATDPKDMMAQAEPNSITNDSVISIVTSRAHRVVTAWGNHGSHLGRDKEVRKKLALGGTVPMCLKVSKTGQPRHPLYLRMGTVPFALN